jgi:prepilin-type N-terminal cleavage/methylation domain-containing protein
MKTKRNRSGFSMIEMLVAAAILVVLVMMLAMLFQGTSTAWRIGSRRADGYMRVRSVLGAMQRDASAAVDQNAIEPNVRRQLGGSQSFSSGLRFYTLTGAGADPAMRAVTYVEYTTQGDRRETKLKAGGGTEVNDSNVMDFVATSGSRSQLQTKITDISPVNSSVGSAGLPLYVTIKAQVTTKGYSLDIGAASAGPDKAWNTRDDLQTWVKE